MTLAPSRHRLWWDWLWRRRLGYLLVGAICSSAWGRCGGRCASLRKSSPAIERHENSFVWDTARMCYGWKYIYLFGGNWNGVGEDGPEDAFVAVRSGQRSFVPVEPCQVSGKEVFHAERAERHGRTDFVLQGFYDVEQRFEFLVVVGGELVGEILYERRNDDWIESSIVIKKKTTISKRFKYSNKVNSNSVTSNITAKTATPWGYCTASDKLPYSVA